MRFLEFLKEATKAKGKTAAEKKTSMGGRRRLP